MGFGDSWSALGVAGPRISPPVLFSHQYARNRIRGFVGTRIRGLCLAGRYAPARSFRAPWRWRGWAAGLLLCYGLLFYPLLSFLAGHTYFGSPTFGLLCQTTIFTIGVLALLRSPFPRSLFLAPVLWSLIGAQAAVLLAVPQDLGLWVAAALGILLAMRPPLRGAHAEVSSAGSGKHGG
ncbi:MAG: DUF6064 family protein [Gammaproteobacteria bacterium]|nr:DUF6064 family protein [Gammaproteobacteria bacterium]MDH4254279.1 DUF6064 family protein [Gammaproteobacteria bacterium]MDH5309132.1 DUF6064 family protein [Gammaproteobacteria bacterium]